MTERFVSPQTMQKIDRDAIEKIGIPSIVLMENAKQAITSWMRAHITGDHYYIFAGPGNNGGDALAVARDLLLAGQSVQVYLLGDPGNASIDFQVHLNILKNINCDLYQIDEHFDFDTLQEEIKNNEAQGEVWVLDGIFGTGLDRPVTGLFKAAIECVNKSAAQVLAIDIPSGLNGETGEVMGVAVAADQTLTLQLPKNCFKNYSAPYEVLDIGIPQLSIDRVLQRDA